MCKRLVSRSTSCQRVVISQLEIYRATKPETKIFLQHMDYSIGTSSCQWIYNMEFFKTKYLCLKKVHQVLSTGYMKMVCRLLHQNGFLLDIYSAVP